MATRKCLVDNCNTPCQALFHIPSQKNQRQIWRKILTPYCSTITDKSEKVNFLNLKVCLLHFEDRYLRKYDDKLRRAMIAYPTLFTPEEISSGVSALGDLIFGTLEKLSKINEDHCYNSATSHVDHTYCIEHKTNYRIDTELAAEITDFLDKRHPSQTISKESEVPESSADTNIDDTSNDLTSEKQDEDESVWLGLVNEKEEKIPDRITSSGKIYRKRRFQSYTRNKAERNYSSSTMNKGNSTEDGTWSPPCSLNSSSPNLIDVNIKEPEKLAPEPEPEPEEVINYTVDVTEYGFDGFNFDDDVPMVPEPEALFSWQKELNLFSLDEAGHDVAARPPLLEPSLYDPSAQEEALDTEYQCNECQREITGFRYTCVQCADWDLCGACEAHEVHAEHYLLRIPSPRPYNEIQTVLAAIRQQLLSENLFLQPDLTDGFNVEVKSEPDVAAPEHHSQTEDSSEDSDVEESPPRAPGPREALVLAARPEPGADPLDQLAGPLDLTDLTDLTADIASPRPQPTTIHVRRLPPNSDTITKLMSFTKRQAPRNINFKILDDDGDVQMMSTLQPIVPAEAPCEDPLRMDAVERSDSPIRIDLDDEPTVPQITKPIHPPKKQYGNVSGQIRQKNLILSDDVPTITIDDDNQHAVRTKEPVSNKPLSAGTKKQFTHISPVNISGQIKEKNLVLSDDVPTITIDDDNQGSVQTKPTVTIRPLNAGTKKQFTRISPINVSGQIRQNNLVLSDEVPTITIDDDNQGSVQPKPTVSIRPLSADTMKRFTQVSPIKDSNLRGAVPQRITRSQFFTQGYDYDTEDQDMISTTEFLEEFDDDDDEYDDEPTRMDVDSPTVPQRITRSKVKSSNVPTSDRSPVKGTDVMRDEELHRIGGTYQTRDELISGNRPGTGTVPVAECVSENVVLRVPADTNTTDLKRALRCIPLVLLQPLPIINVQDGSPPRKRLK